MDQVSPELTTSSRIGLTDSTPVNHNVRATSGSAAVLTSAMRNVGFGGEKEVPDAPACNEELDSGRAPMLNAYVGPGDMSRKLLTMRRKLLLQMKDFFTSPMRKSESNFGIDALECVYSEKLR